MSLIKAIRQQLGLSVTPANNFTWDASADNGTAKLARGNAGATTQDIMVVDAAGKVSFPQNLNTPVFSGYNAGPGSIPNNTLTKLHVSSQIDTAGWWNAGNTRYIPQVAGYYEVTVTVTGTSSMAALQLAAAAILKNGAPVGEGTFVYGNALANVSDSRSMISYIVAMNGTTDFIEPAARVVGNGALSVLNFFMQIKQVRA